jgi:hypothetical protein
VPVNSGGVGFLTGREGDELLLDLGVGARDSSPGEYASSLSPICSRYRATIDDRRISAA